VVGDLSKSPRGTNELTFVDQGFIPTKFLKGQLAESWETADPLTIVFHLRKGVIFPNRPGVMASRELTADDVVFCINRLHESPYAGATRYAMYAKPAASAKDKYTVAVKMKEYSANWIAEIGWGYYTKIYAPEVVKADINAWQNANGTGPFILKSYVSGASLTFEKNPNYWGTTTIGGKEFKLPFVDKLQWLILADESTQLAALRTGKIDIIDAVRYIYKDTLAQTNPDLARWGYINPTQPIVTMRMDVKPFNDIRVRRAMSMAIDRKGYIDTFWGGNADMLAWPYPSWWGSDFYTPIEELPQSARELYEFNPTKAKQLLTEAGYPNGFKTEMVTLAGADQPAFLAANWKQNLGVEVELKPYTYTVQISIMFGKTHKAMFLQYKSNNDPFTILSNAGNPDDRWNVAMMNDPYFNENFLKAKGMTDEDDRNKLLKDLNVYVIDQAGYVMLPTGYSYAYAQPWVKNWYGELSVGARNIGPIQAHIWIDSALKAKKTGR
jgi:peptide/nickel transport system substrate-binding protein